MAKRNRDYAAEYARRKARLAEQGKQRDTKAEYQRSLELARKRGYRSQREAKRASRILKANLDNLKFAESAAWSRHRAVTDTAKFHPERSAKLGVSIDEYTDAYWGCWVGGYQEHGRNSSESVDGMVTWWELNNYFPDNEETGIENERHIRERYNVG